MIELSIKSLGVSMQWILLFTDDSCPIWETFIPLVGFDDDDRWQGAGGHIDLLLLLLLLFDGGRLHCSERIVMGVKWTPREPMGDCLQRWLMRQLWGTLPSMANFCEGANVPHRENLSACRYLVIMHDNGVNINNIIMTYIATFLIV